MHLGTGKSFLIEVLCMQLNNQFQDYVNPKGWIVAVLAPTGIAAYNVKGLTIHRFMKLPIFNSNQPDQYWKLSEENLKLIRTLVPLLKLIIIGNFLFLTPKNNDKYNK